MLYIPVESLGHYNKSLLLANTNFQVSLSTNNQPTLQKSKSKKDSNDKVEPSKENKNDCKYKTELCKGFSENGFCPYGNKCRFAHGRQDLFDKVIACKKYKQKECMSFFKNNYCCYGSRCHFRHEQRKLNEIERSVNALNLELIKNDFETKEEEIFEMSINDLEKKISSANAKATRKISRFINDKKVLSAKYDNIKHLSNIKGKKNFTMKDIFSMF